MTIELLEALATDLLEYKHLVSLYLVIEDSSLDNSALHIGSTHFESALVLDQQHFAELHDLAFGLGKSLNENLVASLNFELLACNIYNCVHKNKTNI